MVVDPVSMYYPAPSFKRHALRAPVGLARGPGAHTAHGRGLRPRAAGAGGGPLPRSREDRPGLRQPQHAHAQGLPQGLRPGDGRPPGGPFRVALHAAPRQLAQHGRVRVECPDPAMPEPPLPGTGPGGRRSGRLVPLPQRKPQTHQVAMDHRGRPHPAAPTVPDKLTHPVH